MLKLGHRVRSHLSIFRNFWKPLLKYKKHVVYYGTHFSIRCRSIPPFASLSKLHDIKQSSAGWGILSAVPPDYRLSLLGRFWMPYTSECSIRRPFEQTRVIIPHALGAKQWSFGRTMRYGVPWDHCLTSLGQIHSAVFLVTDCSILVPPGTNVCHNSESHRVHIYDQWDAIFYPPSHGTTVWHHSASFKMPTWQYCS